MLVERELVRRRQAIFATLYSLLHIISSMSIMNTSFDLNVSTRV